MKILLKRCTLNRQKHLFLINWVFSGKGALHRRNALPECRILGLGNLK